MVAIAIKSCSLHTDCCVYCQDGCNYAQNCISTFHKLCYFLLNLLLINVVNSLAKQKWHKPNTFLRFLDKLKYSIRNQYSKKIGKINKTLLKK